MFFKGVQIWICVPQAFSGLEANILTTSSRFLPTKFISGKREKPEQPVKNTIKEINVVRIQYFTFHLFLRCWLILSASPRIWEQLLFNIRWLIYYLWWSIANRNSHFSFLHHISEANASYLEWNGKCFIAEWNEDWNNASAVFALLRRAKSEKDSFLWSTPVGVWSILRHCRKIWSTADAVWSKAFSGFIFFALKSRQKNGGWNFYLPPPLWMAFLA